MRCVSDILGYSTICSSAPAPRPCLKSQPTPSTSEPGLASSAFCTPGDRTCACILTSTASFPQVVSIQVTRAGFIPSIPSSFLSRFSAVSSAASISRFFNRRSISAALDYPATLVRMLLKDDWVVYAKPAFGEPTRVLRYLGRYTHRVAISNQRLLSFDGRCVRFRWKDYAHGNKQCIMTLTAIEFLRRFCQHVLPRGFVRIRHFGYLASAHRTSLLARARPQLECQPLPSSHLTNSPLAISRCLRCGANMNIGPNLTAQQLAYRCNLPDSS